MCALNTLAWPSSSHPKMVGMPEPSVDMGMKIAPRPTQENMKSYI